MDIVAVELIKQLPMLEGPHDYVVFAQEDEAADTIRESAKVRIVKTKRAPYPYWEQVVLPREAARHNVALLHCTSNTAPLRLDVPLVLTLHDIIYLEQVNLTRGTAYQIAGNLYRRWNVPRVVKKASRILTVSAYERTRIREHFGLPEAAVHTVYNGVGDHFRKVEDQSALRAIRVKYNLPDSYVFYLGNTDPKKNLEGVLRALSLLRQRGALNFKLLMLDIDRAFLQRMAARIGDTEILSNIAFSGYVPNAELPAIYSMADLFLYPSLRESFGIPILEAMACGTPVITSNTSSMPEVAGDAALFVSPQQPETIASALINLRADVKLRQHLSMRGLERAKEFSWRKNALKTLEIYNSLSKSPNPHEAVLPAHNV